MEEIKLSDVEQKELERFYTAVGFIVIHWSFLETSLELTANLVFLEGGGSKRHKLIPRGPGKLFDFLEDCFSNILKLRPFQAKLENLIKEAKTLKKIRDDLAHGTMESLKFDRGIYRFVKLRNVGRGHKKEQGEFDFNRFPALARDFSDLVRKMLNFRDELRQHLE